jgi:hypothetical protein
MLTVVQDEAAEPEYVPEAHCTGCQKTVVMGLQEITT